jgi:hypothetical protein
MMRRAASSCWRATFIQPSSSVSGSWPKASAFGALSQYVLDDAPLRIVVACGMQQTQEMLQQLVLSIGKWMECRDDWFLFVILITLL